jgi:hypothetical protein
MLPAIDYQVAVDASNASCKLWDLINSQYPQLRPAQVDLKSELEHMLLTLEEKLNAPC